MLVYTDNLKFQLYNGAGVKVIEETATMTQTSIDVSNLPSDTYTLIITYNGVPESHQIVIS